MSMTAGDFEFDSIFRQDPAGESDDAEEIFYREISYILWIVFIILMPILLTNMLVNHNAVLIIHIPYILLFFKVGLAIGDIQLIQNESELKKLSLQVSIIMIT